MIRNIYNNPIPNILNKLKISKSICEYGNFTSQRDYNFRLNYSNCV